MGCLVAVKVHNDIVYLDTRTKEYIPDWAYTLVDSES